MTSLEFFSPFSLLALLGCVSAPPPVHWHEVDRTELALTCRDTDVRIRGCVVSRADGDHIYTLPVVRP